MKLPTGLIQKVQHNYVGAKHKDGVYTFQSLDEETIGIVIKTFFEWSEKKGLLEDGKIDLTLIKSW